MRRLHNPGRNRSLRRNRRPDRPRDESCGAPDELRPCLPDARAHGGNRRSDRSQDSAREPQRRRAGAWERRRSVICTGRGCAPVRVRAATIAARRFLRVIDGVVKIRFARARRRTAIGRPSVIAAAIGRSRAALNSEISRGARIGGPLRDEFRERIFLTDETRKFGERVFSAANARRCSRGRLWLWLPKGPRGPDTLFAHSLGPLSDKRRIVNKFTRRYRISSGAPTPRMASPEANTVANP